MKISLSLTLSLYLVRKSTNEDGEVGYEWRPRSHIATEHAPGCHLLMAAWRSLRLLLALRRCIQLSAVCTTLPHIPASFRSPSDGEVVGVELCGRLARTRRSRQHDIGVDVGLVFGQLVAREGFLLCQPRALPV